MINDTNLPRDDTLLNHKIELEVKKYGVLKNAFNKIYESEVALMEKRNSSFDQIHKIEEKDNPFLSNIYTEFVSTMKSLEGFRKKQIDKINDKILPATVYYPEKVKSFKKDLGKITEVKKLKEKQHNELQRAETQAKQDPNKIGQLKASINQNDIHEKTTGVALEKNILDFEASRTTDNKFLFLHYIHSELAYHANALQSLSELYAKVNCHEPKECLQDFVTKYKLNSVRDLNLEDTYGYKSGETHRKLEMHEKRKKGEIPSNTQKKQSSNIVGVNVSPSMASPTGSNVNKTLDKDEIDHIGGGVSSNQQIGMSSNLKPSMMNLGKGLVSSQIK
jgi:hypothetical protein